jgi:hypothetical protein
MKYFSKKQTAIFWLFVLAIGLLSSLDATACDGAYLKIGAGFKFQEDDSFMLNGEKHKKDPISPISARIELGVQKGAWSYGVSHGSQWADGAPFNDRDEPHRSEVFLDYRWGL